MATRSNWLVSSRIALGFCALPFALASAPAAQIGAPRAVQRISRTQGGLGAVLDKGDWFGSAVASLGDLDGDGTCDIAVGATGDDDGGTGRGAVWILFLKSDGTVKAKQKISDTQGGLGSVLTNSDQFGFSLGSLGDLDGDGVVDLAVGAAADDDGGVNDGALWILFLNGNGTVKAKQKISATSGGFGSGLDPGDAFGSSVTRLGDLDGDSVTDLVVGAENDDDGGGNFGALWILFLNADGTVKAKQKISATTGGFAGVLQGNCEFGVSVATLGDLDHDGVPDLVAGAPNFAFGHCKVWILFLHADGTVKSQHELNRNGVTLFGSALASYPDLDGDGNPELAVGAPFDDGDGYEFDLCELPTWVGAVWIELLNSDGSVKSEQKISNDSDVLAGRLGCRGYLGTSVAFVDDLDHDGNPDLVGGAPGEEDWTAAFDGGSAWVVFLDGQPCLTLGFQAEDDLVTPLANGQSIDSEFARRVTITSTGANAGAAVYDSTSGGVNDPGLDPSLLVRHGNLLLLQDDAHAAQTVPGVFDVPVRDPDGGDLVLDFHARVEPRSLVLVDLAAPNQSASVTLVDDTNLTRVYTVPAGWTGAVGARAMRTLDLATLAPQLGNAPGFLQASAAESPGFAADRVRRIVAHFDGAGAIDDVSWCTPHSGLARASATPRNGSGVNPLVLSSLALPVLGGTWDVRLDCSAHASGFAALLVQRHPVTFTTAFGELLAGGGSYLQRTVVHHGSSISFAEPVPNDLALVGLLAAVQGICTGSPGAQLSNALDVVLGF